jgi:hypothetical protein
VTDDEFSIPNDDSVSPADVQPGADLSDADLSDADLSGADLSDADLSRADLLGAHLYDADLSDADLLDAHLLNATLSDATLRDADLSNTILHDADLSKAILLRADLSDATLLRADLRDADLSDADLRSTDLRDADLRGADLDDVVLSRGTIIDAPRKLVQTGVDRLRARKYDQIARTNNELRTAYSANGLTSRARTARVRERKARRREARAEGGTGWIAWLWSILAQVFTGYGIQLRWITGMMMLLYLGSASVYSAVGGMSLGESLYYSVVTFTTSPPTEPNGLVMRAVAGFETFAGTAATLFLGYVLGTRERV